MEQRVFFAGRYSWFTRGDVCVGVTSGVGSNLPVSGVEGGVPTRRTGGAAHV
jgi:hypothetical protein